MFSCLLVRLGYYYQSDAKCEFDFRARTESPVPAFVSICNGGKCGMAEKVKVAGYVNSSPSRWQFLTKSYNIAQLYARYLIHLAWLR